MRIAVVSDVHANLAAVEAVLRHAEGERALDAVWSLGDLVGYGPQPSDCLALLRGQRFHSVAGNHDLAASAVIDTEDFNPAAAAANAWNASQLDEDERSFLRGLPRTLELEAMQLAHGSLRDPVWEYLITIPGALAQFERMTARFSFVGHTHVPLVFIEGGEGGEGGESAFELDYEQPEAGSVRLLGEQRLILNPGSVGQPRDGDPRAAYAIYDTAAQTVVFHRVEYEIARTQAAMVAAELPRSLIERLSHGR
ncbi:MAG TPA: metallophosphoesterase family protein [Dehalococcoidia bacterium]|nr:metallophosphoesterase family protein [Dehalococcoidia bacterium]